MSTKRTEKVENMSLPQVLEALTSHGLVLARRPSRHGCGLVDYRIRLPAKASTVATFFFKLAANKLRDMDVFSSVVNDEYIIVPAVWEPSSVAGDRP